MQNYSYWSQHILAFNIVTFLSSIFSDLHGLGDLHVHSEHAHPNAGHENVPPVHRQTSSRMDEMPDQQTSQGPTQGRALTPRAACRGTPCIKHQLVSGTLWLV